MDLPAPLDQALAPLFETLPSDRALSRLVVEQVPDNDMTGMLETLLRHEALRERPVLHAGLWLYIDELDRSHTVSQGIDDATGSFWHGIMHRREGDFPNSHHWFRKTGEHPVIPRIDGYDPHAFIDAVEAHQADGPQDLIDLQRREWQALFSWCASDYEAGR